MIEEKLIKLWWKAVCENEQLFSNVVFTHIKIFSKITLNNPIFYYRVETQQNTANVYNITNYNENEILYST